MAYKIFFAFQMDTEDKYCKGFIQTAIDGAIQKLKLENIKIKLDYGFKNTPGTPSLIDEMLKKSKESDMVLVDLTFTSSKKWFNSKKKDLFGYEFGYNKKGSDKKSPNPNVLLETGYAWANKGSYRTLAIMNTAFGEPDELPVDLKGFRWGITYNLNEKNYSDKKNIRNELTKNLYTAFKDAINAESSYQIEKWAPFKINQQLERYHKYPYVINPKLKIEIEKLQDYLINYKGTIRVAGVKGSGKSRLVFEVFRKNKYYEQNILENNILYFDIKGTSYLDISKKIVELSNLNQLKIVIIDNCNEDTHEKVENEFFETNLRLVTIEPNSFERKNIKPNIIIDEDIRQTVFNTIFNEKYPSTSSSLLYTTLNGDLNNLVPIIMSGIEEDNINKSTNDLLINIIGQDKVDLGALKLLTAISLFEKIGISGEKTNQLELVRDTFVGCSEEEIIEFIELLNSKGLISKKGDFVVANSFKNELVNHWKTRPIENINEIVINVSKKWLWYNFSKKFFELLTSPGNEHYIQILNSEGGALLDDEFIDSDPGGEFLDLLEDYYPKIAMEILAAKIGRL